MQETGWLPPIVNSFHKKIKSVAPLKNSYTDLNDIWLDFFFLFKQRESVTYYQQAHRSLTNCIDSDCVVKILIQCAMKYEMSVEHLSNEIKAYNDLNVNYLVKNVAMKCVSSSLAQINHNFNIGKQMMAACFHKQKQAN